MPSEMGNYESAIVVDGSNGIGGVKIKELIDRITGLEIKVINSGEDELNKECGAEYVHKQ